MTYRRSVGVPAERVGHSGFLTVAVNEHPGSDVSEYLIPEGFGDEPLAEVQRVAVHRADLHLRLASDLANLVGDNREHAIFQLGRSLVREGEGDDVARLNVPVSTPNDLSPENPTKV